MRRRLLVLAALLVVVGGVTRADISFTKGGSGCSSNCTLTGTTTIDRLAASGTAPASCAVTGAGAAGSCAIVTGSTDSAGIVTITTDSAGTAATGTITLTFTAAQGAVLPVCMAILQGDGNGVNWSATASVRATQSSTAAACVWAFDNTAALTVSESYQLSYIIVAK